MKLMVHKPPPEQTIFQRDKNTAAVSPAKHKWKISLNRPSSSVSSKTTPVQHTQQHPPQQGQTPKEFLCPVFGSLMADPVIVSSGHTFERACVQACKTLGFSPTTADAIPPDFSNVIPNLALKSAILNWCSNRFLEPPKPLDSSSAEKLVRTLIDSQKPKPDTHRKKKDLKVSASEKELIQGIATNPSVRDNHASTEVTRRPTHFYSSSDESVKSTLPLQLATRPSCYSSSSSSEMETLNPNSKVEEEEEEDFVTKLKSPQVCEIEDALTSLRKMTRTREESRARLCTPQLLSALRSLIISRYTVIEVNSVALLVNLSLEKSNKVKIVRSGIVPPLINVLKGGSPEAQEHASGALFSLALDDENKTAIGVLGALQPLLHLLRSESKRTRQDSALALYHLSLVQSNRSKLVKLGSVPVLINMLRSGHMRGRVLLILCNLASCWEGRTAVLDSGGVECLMRILRGENLEESARESCVAVLYGLSHVGLRFKGLAMAAGGAEVLRKVERTGSERGREKARKMLEMMRRRKEMEETVEEVDWEELLDSGLMSRSRVRPEGSSVNSSEF